METERKMAAKRNGAARGKAVAAQAPVRTRRKTATTTKAEPSRQGITAEERQNMIAQAAYLKAERRGFTGGSPDRDWLEAEAEIDAMLIKPAGNRD